MDNDKIMKEFHEKFINDIKDTYNKKYDNIVDKLQLEYETPKIVMNGFTSSIYIDVVSMKDDDCDKTYNVEVEFASFCGNGNSDALYSVEHLTHPSKMNEIVYPHDKITIIGECIYKDRHQKLKETIVVNTFVNKGGFTLKDMRRIIISYLTNYYEYAGNMYDTQYISSLDRIVNGVYRVSGGSL